MTTIGFPQTGGAWLISRADLAGRDGVDLILSWGAIDEGNSGGPVIKGGKVIGVVQGFQGKFAQATPDVKDAVPLSFDEALDRMTKAAAKFNPEKIKMEDVARSGGAVDEAD